MEIKVNEKETEVTSTAISDVSKEVRAAIAIIFQKHGVMPDEVFPYLAESIVHFLVPLADVMGYGKEEIVHVFGEGLATAQLEVKK